MRNRTLRVRIRIRGTRNWRRDTLSRRRSYRYGHCNSYGDRCADSNGGMRSKGCGFRLTYSRCCCSFVFVVLGATFSDSD